MRLGLFGGTFNPIHVGHLRAAEEVREAVALDRVIFMPSHLPPHKELSDNVEGYRRLEIVKMAVRTNPFFDVSGYEVESRGNSYSIRTIEHIRDAYGCIPHFILGQDAFNEISTWYKAQSLFDLTHFVVMSRPDAPKLPLDAVLGKSAARFQETARGFVSDTGHEIIFVEVTAYAVSSSNIREAIKQGRSIRYLVPGEVEDYIRNEKIYIQTKV